VLNPNNSIIDSGYKFVLSITGGGQEIIGELTKYGGMSSCLLECNVPYSQPALEKLIGHLPTKTVSKETALKLAMVSYLRAKEYTGENKNIYGIGVTSSLVKLDGERGGREHKVCIGLHGTNTYYLEIILKQNRTRLEEEELVSNIIGAILEYAGYEFDIFVNCSRSQINGLLSTLDFFNIELGFFKSEYNNAYIFLKDGLAASQCETPLNPTLFPVSMNPLHSGHITIKEFYEKKYDKTVYYELCLKNADKGQLDFISTQERIKQVNELFITNLPLFIDKFNKFPYSSFLMGVDTFHRILNPKYYNLETIRDVIKKYNHHFDRRSSLHIFNRVGYEGTYNYLKGYLEALDLDCSGIIFEDDFIPTDISSTKIRKGQL
jgi:hypothetical protein